jgi:hypothetical protein
MMKVNKGLKLDIFWGLLPSKTEDFLLGLEANGKHGVATYDSPAGKVMIWLDACSEGADRGGYVKWIELLDVQFEDGSVILEADTDGSCLFFANRSIEL